MLLRQRSLTGLGWHGPFARHQAATGDEATETCANGRSTFRICTHRRDRYRDPAFEVKLCAACRTQQVVYKSSRSKRRGARCIGDRVGVLPNGSMHPDVPASTFVVVQLTGGLRTTSSPPVLPESQAVRRGVPPYSESRRTCPRMACAGPQPTGIRAI